MRIKAIVGKYVVPVDIELKDGKMWFTFGYNKDLIADIKGLRGAQWHPDEKIWSADINAANFFVLDVMTRSGEFGRYYSSVPPTEGSERFWKHQNEMYAHMKYRRRAICAGEMRTGKTLPMLTLVEELGKPTLLVSTKSALRGIQREVHKWGIQTPITLMSYRKFTDYEGEVPPVLVFDECQKIKTPTSQVTAAAINMSNLMREQYKGEEFILALSGTPAPKDPSDWWSICEVVRPGYIRENTKDKLKRRCSDSELTEGPMGAYWKFKGWKDDEIHALYRRLRGLVITFLKADCLELPLKEYEEVILPVSPEALKVSKFIVSNEENASAARTKLMQLSDGFMYEYDYVDNKKIRTGYSFVGSPKLDRLKEDLEEYEDVGRIIIYAGFQASVDLIEAVCLESGWNILRVDGRGWQAKNVAWCDPFTVEQALDEMDRSTNKGGIERLAFVAEVDSAGTGLELSASPVVIYYSNSNKGESRMQTEDRAYSNNMDKQRGLKIIDYIHLPSDKKILESLKVKKHLQGVSMGELKEVLG